MNNTQHDITLTHSTNPYSDTQSDTLVYSPPYVSHYQRRIETLYKFTMALLCLVAIFMVSPKAHATDDNSEHLLTDNLRFTVDASSRSTRFSLQNRQVYVHALGFDMHKVFSGPTQDIGTLILQGYLTRLDNHPAPPGFFDSGDDTEFIYRIFNFNYTGLQGNAPNIRIGHYEVAYGLEHAIDTNGTLRQYQQGRNLGIKADWGVSLNKQLSDYEYEIGWSSGGNQELKSQNGSYVISARIGTPRDENAVYGLSLYNSELGGTERDRIGFDTRQYFGRHGLFAELSIGKNNDNDVVNGFLEWNVRSNRESWLYYTQLSYLSNETGANATDEALQGVLGLQYTPDNNWDISTQYNRDLSVFGTAQRQTLFSVQARYRY